MTEILSVHLNKEASNVFLYDAKIAPETVIRKTVKTGINDMKVFKLKSHVVLKELEENVHG